MMKRVLIAAIAILIVVVVQAQRPGLGTSYAGPLIDTHAHIVIYRSLDEDHVEYRVDSREGAPLLTAQSYVDALDRNNIKCVLGFHGIAFDARQEELLNSARRLRSRYPGRFVLFAEIFRDNPVEWYDAAAVNALFDEGLFLGFGEIQFANPPLGDPDAQVPIVRPNTDRFMGLYDAMESRRLFVMAHPASLDGVVEAIDHNPKLTWLVHGPQMHERWTAIDQLGKLLEKYPNLYYTVDFSESMPDFLRLTKTQGGAQSLREFLDAMNENSSMYLAKMTMVWKGAIEAHPVGL